MRQHDPETEKKEKFFDNKWEMRYGYEHRLILGFLGVARFVFTSFTS